ncbi:hypothetical protein F7725_018033 [Dissostichus mawsoni]|uniref:Uncharacterized protein n=1 Tax=Dissostichus mawsoni TaxID=36200 RepID=A0A7J5XQB3_DISMA|nr:hypothetical protein F7725_018033 [Dissostichus mawsoni]
MGIRDAGRRLPACYWIYPVTLYTVRPPLQEQSTNLRSNGVQSNVISSQPQVTVTQYTVTVRVRRLEFKRKQEEINQHYNINSKLMTRLSPPGLCATFLPCILGCQGSVCDDWLIMGCLPLCGLCQMAREQKRRG